MAPEQFFIRVLAALGLGLLLGLDREIKNASVGVRTFALVTVGSAVYTMLTLHLGEISANRTDFSIDPSRLIQGLIGGIGFLGAGAIIGGGGGSRVQGIATGAAIWVAGGVGVACGLALYWEAITVTLVSSLLFFTTEFVQTKWGGRDHLIRGIDDEPDDTSDDAGKSL